MSIEVTNGLPEGADQGVSLELTLAEAEAVKSWLLKPSADGSAAIDDENAKSVMVKLGARAWWLPRWLSRLVPHFSIEGEDYFAKRDAAEKAGA